MKTFTYTYKIIVLIFMLFAAAPRGHAQKDSILRRIPSDTSRDKLNMDYIYNRPFLAIGKAPVAIGGYLEANTQYAFTNGVTEGFSFQMRRMTLFLASSIAKRIRFLSEIEFEDGTKEINIEFAAIDINMHPMLNLRGGIIMNPIGAFNQNHDGPRWDFIDRPLSATTLIPSTLSSAGFGLYGKSYVNRWVLGYEAYLTNGFDDKIIANEQNRTSLAASKLNPERFEESNSGLPMFTGKVAVRNRQVGELGLSCMTGVYNKFQEDGLILDSRRKATVLAVDFNTSLFRNRFNITGEACSVMVNVPSGYSQQFGNRQYGGFMDMIAVARKGNIFGWEKARLEAGVRLEYVDYNKGRFNETSGNIRDDVWAIVPTIAFRPVAVTVLRFNYRYMQAWDILGNPPANTGVWQFGFSSYF